MSSARILDLSLWHAVQYKLQIGDVYPHKQLTAALGLIVAASVFFFFRRTPRQRYIAGVLVVGGHDDGCINRNRLRFVTDSKSMLQEGYQQVRLACSFSPKTSE